ncbi:succinyl-diaminopimelate desuccinylase [Acidiferrobacter sp.]|uniref:succinyl-diaminopimelate desuccinylase n=1 Tax=Acidiferrobacter sp. TaxID=1872107 RepID=UPI00262F777A|nr:succinyl-diaminopimelate desuccinylase [Acidiferrobacter sp.]
MEPTLALAMELIGRASVTPDDAGCQTHIAGLLSAAGFHTESLVFGEVTNLWARHGTSAPLVVFLGHTDVVPPGPLADWTTPPFVPAIRDGMLYGRGAADMKGAVAAFVQALIGFVHRHPGHPGSVGLLLTSDEEGPAVNGTIQVLKTLASRGESIDYCLVGEPSCQATLGDTVKNGRRGSLNGELVIHGVQGHVAYPERADNPITRFAPALQSLVSMAWDQGSADFPPTRLQFSHIEAGTGADNVIPGRLRALFNLRYGPATPADVLRARIEEVLAAHKLRYTLTWRLSGEPFLSTDGPLKAALAASILAETGHAPHYSTGGGTSDGRFVAPFGAQVLEFGPPNGSIHKVNEAVSVDDLARLTRIYQGTLERIWAL